MEPLSIALVSDFYLPDLGGVELQIKELGKYLRRKGHRVIVITHCRPNHFGLMEVEGIPTYYLAWGYSASGAVYPTFFMDYP
jgi:phosphatidylinositol glycan class A protein